MSNELTKSAGCGPSVPMQRGTLDTGIVPVADDWAETLRSLPTLLTIRETEGVLNRSHTTVYGLIADGSLEAVKFGKRRTFVTSASAVRLIRSLPKLLTPTMKRRMAEGRKPPRRTRRRNHV